jgi:hypothetical protein
VRLTHCRRSLSVAEAIRVEGEDWIPFLCGMEHHTAWQAEGAAQGKASFQELRTRLKFPDGEGEAVC